MKILIVSHEYPPVGGGGANACMYLSKEYTRVGHDVTIVSVWFEGLPETENSGGVQIIRIRTKRKYKEHCSFSEMADYLCKAWPVIKRLQKEQRFDICQVFFGIPSGPVGYLLKKKYHLPYIIRFGGGDIPGFQDRFAFLYKLLGPFLKVIWNNADALVANSKGLKKLAEDFYDKRQIDIIYNGVDMEKFYPGNIKKSGLNDLNILFVSRLIERKGLQFVIPKLREIQEISHKNIHLTIVGDGPYRKELEKIAAENACTDMIRFEGQKDKSELLRYYQMADIFILPSRKEGMPNVVLEAMACGLPVVMTPCEGSCELIADNGIVTPIDTFAETLTKLCADEDLRKIMGQNSLTHIEKFFKWEIIGRRYINILEKTLQKGF
ncbi:MAG: glycosyltransferase family 4 protein [Lachnospiraceae bacterium]|nr:glycosyltransferase family 4 protein [Lachnospiraceae bacterium]